MNAKKCTLLVAAGLAVAALSAPALVLVNKTFRTTGFFIGVTQGTDTVTSHPQFDNINFAGRNLVNLAMGRSLTDNSVPGQVMAMTFECDLSAASLVVYDRSTSNVVATIAQSTSMDSIKQQDTKKAAPNRARFVGQFQINQNGNPTNGLQGGFLTIAGHVRLNTVTGCPEPVLVGLDRDSLDRAVGDRELTRKEDPDSDKLTQRAGLAHLIGVVDVVNIGNTNTILVPYGHLSFHRELPIIQF